MQSLNGWNLEWKEYRGRDPVLEENHEGGILGGGTPCGKNTVGGILLERNPVGRKTMNTSYQI